jgi:hypothetical protein
VKRFGPDSQLEGARFEPSVPAKEDAFEIDRLTSLASHSARGTEGSKPSLSARASP